VSGVRSNPWRRAQAATSGPPPLTTAMSRASTWTRRTTSTARGAGPAASRTSETGFTSSWSRSRVQSPPFSIRVGTAGRGTM
jgi:hypothetical protein